LDFIRAKLKLRQIQCFQEEYYKKKEIDSIKVKIEDKMDELTVNGLRFQLGIG